jgi:hypothetical protein
MVKNIGKSIGEVKRSIVVAGTMAAAIGVVRIA